MTKVRVGIIFGGKSAEHEVSCRSARNVFQAIDRTRYEPVLIGIDARGRWLSPTVSSRMLSEAATVDVSDADETVALLPESRGELVSESGQTFPLPIDVAFPILHGPFGEDGTVQGLLKLAGIPFVGASVLGSAIGMDKDVMKRLLRDAGFPIADFLVYHAHEKERMVFSEIVARLGLPFFLKPANLGSSVGVAKIHSEEEFSGAVESAFQFDRKIILEHFIPGREIECAVLGNEHPIASALGEIKPHHEFYSYEAKYLDENGASLIIPTDLLPSVAKEIQGMATSVFRALECEGMARVDFFLGEGNKIFVNEINTIPGFTSISMFPKLWEESGIAYADLIDRLIRLAIERFEKEKTLKTKKD